MNKVTLKELEECKRHLYEMLNTQWVDFEIRYGTIQGKNYQIKYEVRKIES